MRTRIIFGLLLAAALAAMLWLDLEIWSGAPLCLVAMALTGAALHEFFAMVRNVGLSPFRLTGMGFGIVLLPYFVWTEELERLGPQALTAFLLAPLLLLVLALMARAYTRPEGFGPQLKNIAVTLFGVIYIAVPMAFLILTRFLTESTDGSREGWDLVMLVVAVTKSSDIGAYFIGTLIGKHKLAPTVSPNKTVEGAIGGIITSVVAALIMVYGMKIKTLMNLEYWLIATISFGIVVGIASLIGDLTESFIKRDTNIKDSGKLLPSFGGVLDLVDSFLVSAPVAYFMLAIFVKFTTRVAA